MLTDLRAIGLLQLASSGARVGSGTPVGLGNRGTKRAHGLGLRRDPQIHHREARGRRVDVVDVPRQRGGDESS
jgi:hypothetical protein